VVPDFIDEETAAATADIEALMAEETYIEGATSSILTNRYERDPKLRAKAIEKHGKRCLGCGFSFGDIYGERGFDYIEVHHIKPISSYGGAMQVNPETDLTVVCANCHRMIHRRTDDPLTIERLREILAATGHLLPTNQNQ
jgi:5-methylcytosine-specific restriction enzyme A